MMETRVTLVLLVGLPGSGKTTLCRALQSHHQVNQECGGLRVIHLCYDDLIPLSVQREFVEQKRTEGESVGIDENNQKEAEVKGRRNTDEDQDTEDSKSGTHDFGKDWKSARLKVHTEVDQFLQYVLTGKVDSEVENFFNIPLEALEGGGSYAILLDDNFYYRSMRYEYFQLARRHSAAFCQLYLECSIEEAVLYNDSRKESVPAGVVTSMGERLQPPQPHLHPWEANTCVLKSEGVGEVCRAWDAVVKSFHLGLSPLEDREAEVAEARRCCSQSVVHQADLCLRAIVKRLVKEALQHTSQGSRPASQVAAGINTGRQVVLADLRGGALVPPHLADAIIQHNRQEFEAFLEEEIKKKIPVNRSTD